MIILKQGEIVHNLPKIFRESMPQGIRPLKNGKYVLESAIDQDTAIMCAMCGLDVSLNKDTLIKSTFNLVLCTWSNNAYGHTYFAYYVPELNVITSWYPEINMQLSVYVKYTLKCERKNDYQKLELK